MSRKAYSNGNKLNVIARLECDDIMRTFNDEKSKKLWMKLHDKKCDICRNASKKSMQIINTDIQCMKGQTTEAYLDNFHKKRECV